jgi:hypothetical protein
MPTNHIVSTGFSENNAVLATVMTNTLSDLNTYLATVSASNYPRALTLVGAETLLNSDSAFTTFGVTINVVIQYVSAV